jgi:hypothetical protein
MKISGNLFSSNPGTLAHLFCKNLGMSCTGFCFGHYYAKIHPQIFLNKK